ncbi:MAG: hypothetical protein QOJ23_4484, partial [Actinomycetota bacterium]|nr:hypothetical protein [Actinomycetota bacterium]
REAAMVKLVYVIRRREGMGPEEFRRYWLEDHAPKVEAAAKEIRACRYVQSHTIDTPLNTAFVESRGLSPAFDGITELWWNSLEDLQAAAATPEGADALQMFLEDEQQFIDHGRSTIFMTEEHEIFDFTG